MPLTDEMREEYAARFAACKVLADWEAQVAKAVDLIVDARDRYRSVEVETSVPWHIVGLIHTMESSGSWSRHLHNGDPLKARTKNVPKGRPVNGKPPFTWEASAIDALTFDGLNTWTDWSIPGTLYKLELFNGMGYRKRGIPSPYLWSGSNQYEKGKYVADGKFDPDAVSKQVGAGVLLRRMVDLNF